MDSTMTKDSLRRQSDVTEFIQQRLLFCAYYVLFLQIWSSHLKIEESKVWHYKNKQKFTFVQCSAQGLALSKH